jgi:GNAT superfamily N-acetyltransferase
MTEPLTDLSNPALVAAVEENVGEWTRLKGTLPGVDLHDDGDVVWIFSTTPGRGGAVSLARFSPETADARISTILAHHRRHLMPTVWWAGPASAPADLGRRLRSHGLLCQRHLPGMVCDLHAMKTDFRAPEGLEIRPLEDFSIFEEYQHPFIGPPSTARRRTLIEGVCLLTTKREPRRAWHFVASLAGIPVGCATLFLGAGVAGLYHVATIPEARRRGIGKAVTLAALCHARDLGYRVSILHASTEGEVIYRQIGFEEVSKVGHWYYSKARQLRERA